MGNKNTKNEILMQPNNLVKSRYNFTSSENKLFYKILYNAQKQHSSNSELYKTTLTVTEIQEAIKNPNDCTPTSIKQKLNLFQQSILEFEYVDEKTGDMLTFSSGLIIFHTFNKEDQSYTITIHEILYKHVTNLLEMQKNGYSSINLSLLFNFKGGYTQRIYTFLRLWSRPNEKRDIKFKVADLKSYLQITNRYNNYSDFKKRVLIPSIEEINSCGNMEIVFDKSCEIRKGRRVVEVIFKVKDGEPRKYFGTPLEENLNSSSRSIFRKFLLENTLMKSSVVDLFITEFSPYMKQFMDSNNPRFSKLLELMGKAMEKDNVNDFGIAQYTYIKKALTEELATFDMKESAIDITEATPKFFSK